ncbi:hypothetical protein HAX54_038357 [Datura stramonium]|uniref:Uncharacterized protein n=1 Tax=Datura stramonium TaxID=4076 RepID=A0ABS8SHZ5_DATST|nr:hypothetical protein [Datura stramonium]
MKLSPGKFSNKEAKHSHFPNPLLQQERVVNHVDSNNTLLEGGTAGHLYGYSLSPSVLHGPGGHGRTLIDSTPRQIGSHTGQLYGLQGHHHTWKVSGVANTIPIDVAGRSSASDAVITSELYRSSGLRAADVVPSAAAAHQSSYLYWPR